MESSPGSRLGPQEAQFQQLQQWLHLQRLQHNQQQQHSAAEAGNVPASAMPSSSQGPSEPSMDQHGQSSMLSQQQGFLQGLLASQQQIAFAQTAAQQWGLMQQRMAQQAAQQQAVAAQFEQAQQATRDSWDSATQPAPQVPLPSNQQPPQGQNQGRLGSHAAASTSMADEPPGLRTLPHPSQPGAGGGLSGQPALQAAARGGLQQPQQNGRLPHVPGSAAQQNTDSGDAKAQKAVQAQAKKRCELCNKIARNACEFKRCKPCCNKERNACPVHNPKAEGPSSKPKSQKALAAEKAAAAKAQRAQAEAQQRAAHAQAAAAGRTAAAPAGAAPAAMRDLRRVYSDFQRENDETLHWRRATYRLIDEERAADVAASLARYQGNASLLAELFDGRSAEASLAERPRDSEDEREGEGEDGGSDGGDGSSLEAWRQLAEASVGSADQDLEELRRSTANLGEGLQTFEEQLRQPLDSAAGTPSGGAEEPSLGGTGSRLQAPEPPWIQNRPALYSVVRRVMLPPDEPAPRPETTCIQL